MTRFKFKLDAALRLRELRAESEIAKLRELLSQQARWEKSQASLVAERLAASRYVHDSARSEAGDLRALSSFTLSLEAHAAAVREALARLQRQISEQRGRIIIAERERLGIQKLRDRRQAEWNMQVQRETELRSQELWLCGRTNTIEPEPG